MTGSSSRREGSERGQVVLVFALLLPVILAIAGMVAGIGNWYVHGKNLQTKADAGAFAGGGEWEFPCGSEIDTRIRDTARLYAGSSNPQVGKVPDANIKVRLNALDWYDDDSNPGQGDFDNPNGSVCSALSLDVKVTEDNSFPLLSLIPLFPDIKRRARVEIQEAEGATGLLPIAVRAPEPVSAAAVFYNEKTKVIQDVKYFVKTNPTRGIPDITNLPGSIQGWTTQNPQDADFWASFEPSSANGVAIAISFRGACNTGLPDPNNNITTTAAPCFEDTGFTFVNDLCNQGSGTQIVNCYYATGSWPTESVQAGLHFIRGYPELPGNPIPALESAYLTSVSCAVNGTPSPAYFNAHPSSTCQGRLTVKIDAGTIQGLYPPPAGNLDDLRASDVQVRYRLVRGDGSTFCNYGVNCDLIGSGSGSNMTFSTQGNGSSPHLPFTAKSGVNAVAIEVRIRNAPNHPNSACQGSGGTFSDNCRWFWTGERMVSTSVPPTNAEILAQPVQRAFRGSNVTSSTNVLWLRLTTDGQCDGSADYQDTDAASQPTGNSRCFFMEMGLKGGIAKDANEPAVLFNDGTASNQTGTVDCDPNIPQGQELEDGVVDGCQWQYGKHPFNYPGPNLCPPANALFSNGNPKDPNYNPGPPWDDGSWPPTRCIDTRQTGTANQLEKGLKFRFFGDKNTSSNPSGCPGGAAGGPGFIKGRNYWDKDTANGYAGVPALGYVEGSHQTNFDPRDPRIVTIFLSTTEAFTRPPGKTHPVTGFIRVYITGFGKLGDAINGNDDDPCPGSAPPPDMDSCSGPECNNYVLWGHILNYPIPSPNATPSGRRCNPGGIDACVATLVE